MNGAEYIADLNGAEYIADLHNSILVDGTAPTP